MQDKQRKDQDQTEEDIWIIPSENGYKDRKMAKWQGFILSDHADLVRENEAKRKRGLPPKEKQSLEVISSLLHQAFVYRKQVFVQMDYIENGLYNENYSGCVTGMKSHWVYIQTIEDVIAAEWEAIRHVEIASGNKWYKIED